MGDFYFRASDFLNFHKANRTQFSLCSSLLSRPNGLNGEGQYLFEFELVAQSSYLVLCQRFEMAFKFFTQCFKLLDGGQDKCLQL